MFEGWIYSLIAPVVFCDVATAILSHYIVNKIAQRAVNKTIVRVLSWIGIFVGGVFLVTVLAFLVVELTSGRVFSFGEFAHTFLNTYWAATNIWFASPFTALLLYTLILGIFVQILKADGSKVIKNEENAGDITTLLRNSYFHSIFTVFTRVSSLICVS